MTIKLIIQFIKERKVILLTFFVFIAVFIMTFYLYSLRISDFLYSASLCFVIGSAVAFIRFLSYRRKYLELQDIKHSVSIENIDPQKSDNAIEAQYLDLAAILFEEKNKIENAANLSRDEQLDYYTMWVHQIKVPLAALKLLIESDAENKSKMMNELFKIDQYVDMVLGYQRTESMSSDLLLKYYSLDSILKQAIRKYSTLFIQKNIRISMSGIDCDVLTDKKWLSFVIEQVLSNSIKYTPNNGEISIYVIRPKTLVIEDNGIGIASEDIRRVFQRGFTGYSGREYKKSTGIGLYLCKRIMSKLSHTIKIESKIGEGTKVIMELDNADIPIEKIVSR